MKKSGFTLIQLSIILTVASLVFVATLPGVQTSLKSSAASVTKMNSILSTMRGYMAANGVLPCPADPTQAIGATNYGVAAANPGTGLTTGNCVGGSPAAAYADTTKNIAIGMVPVKTLGLSYADALDGYGRDITYAVDTNATGNSGGAPCWSSSSLTGAITVNDNGINYNTVAALISHGADGYGAWLPLSGTSGTASRFDNGSTDTSQAANAQVATGGGLTALTSGNFVSFVRKTATSTFDDSIVYKSNIYTLNNLPASAQVYPAITPPSNGTYSSGQVLSFTITYASNVTVTGTPQLDLSALSGGTIGTGNVAYATYQSGSGTTALVFSYTVQNTDSAPTSGLTMNAYIDLNGGTISGGSTCFTAPSLTGVLIGPVYYRTVTIDHTKVPNTDQTNFPVLFSGTYSYLCLASYGGGCKVTNSNGYDIYFTSDAAGTHLLPFERESYNNGTGAVNFWVQVSTVSHTADTVIYLQYGNSGITTDQQNASGTWDSNFKAVYHLASTAFADSTTTADALTNVGSTNTSSGEIANAESFVAASSQYGYSATLPTAVTDNFTMSAWAKPASAPAGGDLVAFNGHGHGTAWPTTTVAHGIDGYGFGIDTSGNWKAQYTITNFSSGVAASVGTWAYIVLAQSSGTGQLYVNGTAAGSSFTPTVTAPTTYFNIGAERASVQQNGPSTYVALTPFDGTIDEVRISSTPRSADWIKTEYNNQSAPDKATYGASGFYTVGSQNSR